MTPTEIGAVLVALGSFIVTVTREVWKTKKESRTVTSKEASDAQKLKHSGEDHAILTLQKLVDEFHQKIGALYQRVDKLSEDHRVALEHATKCEVELANEKKLRQEQKNESDAKIRDLNQRIEVLENERGQR